MLRPHSPSEYPSLLLYILDEVRPISRIFVLRLQPSAHQQTHPRFLSDTYNSHTHHSPRYSIHSQCSYRLVGYWSSGLVSYRYVTASSNIEFLLPLTPPFPLLDSTLLILVLYTIQQKQ